MSIIDRPGSTLRTSSIRTSTGTTASDPIGGRYVSTRVPQPLVEGSYVSTGTVSVPGTHGTYVTTSSPTPRAGGRYTYTYTS